MFLVVLFPFQEKLRSAAQVEVTYFQDPYTENEVDHYCADSAVFNLPEKLAGTQYMEVVRINSSP